MDLQEILRRLDEIGTTSMPDRSWTPYEYVKALEKTQAMTYQLYNDLKDEAEKDFDDCLFYNINDSSTAKD